MSYSDNFISSVTEALYSSLEIEKSLQKSISILKNYFPINLIHVFVLNPESKSIRYLAEATSKSGLLIDETIFLAESYIDELKKHRGNDIVLLESTKSPLLRMANRHFMKLVKKPLFSDISEYSVMILNFNLGTSYICGIGIVSKGVGVFEKAHFKKMEAIRKPLTGAVINLLNYRDLVKSNQRLFKEKTALEQRLKTYGKEELIGSETGLKKVAVMVSQVAALNSPVLITGETGTGKELAATLVHENSARNKGPMVRINCGAIPETLIDSELFGHEKGAFTGADTQKQGYFEQADGGTIFLDEVGELPLSAQVKLLRVLQTMEFNRVGGIIPVSVDVRIVAATNRDLFSMVQEKSFREDLWFRLNVFPIHIPPLRKRKEDLPDLVQHFIRVKSREMNIRKEIIPSKENLNLLYNYDWPGNVRELENIIERALILGKGDYPDFENAGLDTRSLQQEENKPEVKHQTLDELVRAHIEYTLETARCRINGRGGAAELLGINPSTLRSKMKKLNIRINKQSV